jgi:hypothetical protein
MLHSICWRHACRGLTNDLQTSQHGALERRINGVLLARHVTHRAREIVSLDQDVPQELKRLEGHP